jgi:EpsI family protein
MSRKGVFLGASPTARCLVLAVLMVIATAYLGHASRAEELPPRTALAELPLVIEEWKGRIDPPLESRIIEVLGVDDYLLRTYATPNQPPLSLYIGYHDSQRQGDTIHSPLNCMPGAGWTPLEQSRIQVLVPASATGPERPIEVNRVVIGKGLDRQLVLYWYQSHRRVVASEYWGKIYTVLDSVRYNRTDAAMVRVIVPMPDGTTASDVEPQAIAFVQALFPALGKYLPA